MKGRGPTLAMGGWTDSIQAPCARQLLLTWISIELP